jgi:hypothetical protein
VFEVHDGESRDEKLGHVSDQDDMLLTLEGYKDVVAYGLGDAPTNAELDLKAKAIIGAHLSNQHLGVYKACVTSKALWISLEILFNQNQRYCSTMSRRLTLRR